MGRERKGEGGVRGDGVGGTAGDWERVERDRMRSGPNEWDRNRDWDMGRVDDEKATIIV